LPRINWLKMKSQITGKKHILVAVSGNTPQIVTETLYALMMCDKPVPISEVHILTTTKGKQIAWKGLGGPTGAIARFCKDYMKPQIAFTEKHIFVFKNRDGSEMDDIRTTKDNHLLRTQMLSFIKQLTENDNIVLHCSMGGGRRTMSAFMMLALTLFGREEDSLSHVLVSEEFETNSKFFFPPKVNEQFAVRDANNTWIVKDSKEAKIELADIPFARLRPLLGDKLNELKNPDIELLDIAQTKIEISQTEQESLTIDLRNGKAFLGQTEINLRGFNLALFIYYALRKAQYCEEEWRTDCGGCYECYRTPLELDIESLLKTYKIVQHKVSGKQEQQYRNNFNKGELNLLPTHSKIKTTSKKFSDSLEVVKEYRNGQAVYGLKIDKTLIRVISPKPK